MLSAASALPRHPSPSTWPRVPFLVAVGMAAGLGAAEVSAAPVGGLVASTGLLTTLLAMFALKGWPSVASVSTVSSAGGALILAAAVAWLLPSRRGIDVGRVGLKRVASMLARSARPSGSDGSTRTAEGAALEAHLIQLFRQVQDAWDRAEWRTLEGLMTADMLEEFRREREHVVTVGAHGLTDLVQVQVELIANDKLGSAALLSVVFSGRFRDSDRFVELPFRELWMLTRSDTPNAVWRLARHQTLY